MDTNFHDVIARSIVEAKGYANDAMSSSIRRVRANPATYCERGNLSSGLAIDLKQTGCSLGATHLTGRPLFSYSKSAAVAQEIASESRRYVFGLLQAVTDAFEQIISNGFIRVI
jgi:hypothetical protein